jgi:hypothetical protein
VRGAHSEYEDPVSPVAIASAVSPYSLTIGVAVNRTAAGTSTGDLNLQVSAIPEPETYALMLAGLGLLGAVAKRRKGS